MAYSTVTVVSDGSTLIYNVPFPYLSRSHVGLGVSGGFIPSFAWLSNTQIQLSFAPAAGVGVEIYRTTSPQARMVTYTDTGGLTASLLNTEGLQEFYISQELADRASQDEASLATAVVTIDASIATTNAALVANDASLTARFVSDEFVLSSNTSSIAGIRNTLTALAASSGAYPAVVASGSTTPRLLVDRFADIANVKDFGGIGDGLADDAPAIQLAVNTGRPVFLPAGLWRMASPVVILEAVTVYGEKPIHGPTPVGGTWLIIDTTTFTPFTIRGFNARGSSFENLGVFQIHSTNYVTGWAPTVYPWVFDIENAYGEVFFDHIFLAGVYQGIKCINSGRLTIGDIRGQVFKTGIFIDQAYDKVHINVVHFWPYVATAPVVYDWQQASNTRGIVLGRVDGLTVNDLLVFCAWIGIHLQGSSYGNPTKINLGDAYFDSNVHGVQVEAPVTMMISRMTSQGSLASSAVATPAPFSDALNISGAGSRIQIGSLWSEQSESSAINVAGSNNRIDIGSIRCTGYNTLNNGSPAVNLVSVAYPSPPNSLFFSTPPFLEAFYPAPFVAPTSNAYCQMATLSGSLNNVGLAIGAPAQGLSSFGGGSVSVVCGGTESVRFGAPGTTGGPAVARFMGVLQPQAYTVATLPSTSAHTDGIIIVTDSASHKGLAWSDGTTWRFMDGTAVS